MAVPVNQFNLATMIPEFARTEVLLARGYEAPIGLDIQYALSGIDVGVFVLFCFCCAFATRCPVLTESMLIQPGRDAVDASTSAASVGPGTEIAYSRTSSAACTRTSVACFCTSTN
eukprot:3528232-Rhodomonas_salina.3